jgi:hypothetical protein
MAHGHHRRDRSALEAGPLDVLAAIPDPAEDPADELQYMIDEYGNAVCVDERPRRIFVSTASLDEILKPKPVGYVWADGTEHDAPEPVMSKYLVDGKCDPHANDVTDNTLKTGYTIRRGGGGGNGGGVAKTMPAKIPKKRDPDREGAVLAYRVHGLTRGMKEFYHDRPTEARRLLLIFATRRFKPQIIVSGSIYRGRSADRSPLQLYGFFEAELDYLKRDRVGAYETLRDYALEHDGERIRYRDAMFESHAA